MGGSYDVVIVGGGPSGATAGVLLAKNNLSVAIVDKARFPRDKPCAGAISGRSARAIASIYGDDVLPRLARASSDGCRFFNQQAFVAEATEAERLFFVDRKEMDAVFLNAAQNAGCHVLQEKAVAAVDAAQSGVRLSSGETIRAKIILGADGVNSVVRKTCWGKTKQRKQDMGFGLVAEAAVDQLKTAELQAACSRFPHVIFGVLPWGYGWIFPKGNTVSVGVCGRPRAGSEIRGALKWLVDSHFRDGVWESLRPLGHGIPFRPFHRRPGRQRVLLVGDAAGFVEPVTGEGIALALESAELAARAAIQCFSNGDPSAAGRVYNGSLRALLRRLRYARIARWLLFPKPCLRAATRDLNRHPRLVQRYLELVSGKLSYPAYAGCVVKALLRVP